MTKAAMRHPGNAQSCIFNPSRVRNYVPSDHSEVSRICKDVCTCTCI